MELNIRTAIISDIPLIQSLVHKIWPATYSAILSEEQIAYMLARFYNSETMQQQMEQGHRMLILQERKAAIGFAAFECDYEVQTCKLHKIYLLPETQGKGAGKFLLNEVIAQAKQKAQSRLLLNVNRYNKAFEFYKRIGFATIAEEDIDIGNGYFMNDYIMELRLS